MLTVPFRVHVGRSAHGRKQIYVGDASTMPILDRGRIPRVARLMALAIRLERLIVARDIHDFAEAASLGNVSRARLTQIMNLLYLAPDIQEEILFLPPVERGRDPIKEWMVRPIAATPEWQKQRAMWSALRLEAR
jgi:hypothetical protein